MRRRRERVADARERRSQAAAQLKQRKAGALVTILDAECCHQRFGGLVLTVEFDVGDGAIITELEASDSRGWLGVALKAWGMAIAACCILRLDVDDEPSCGVRLQLRPGLSAGVFCLWGARTFRALINHVGGARAAL